MLHDTPGSRALPTPESSQQVFDLVVQALPAQSLQPRRRGRPRRISSELVGMGVLWCLLSGWVSGLDLWRQITQFGVGAFAPIPSCDQVIYNQLGTHTCAWMQQTCAHLSGWLATWLLPYADRSLAPFASQVLALDECILDQMPRFLPELRGLRKGDSALLAGRLACLFDLRTQQWKRIDWLPTALLNSQEYVGQVLTQVQAGALLLFDLGYYNFSFFDGLSKWGIWWIARLRRTGSFTIEHVLHSRDGYFEALVFLGAYSRDRSAYLVRLVRVRYRGEWYSYITNVTDPTKMSGAQIVRLYARRWDIELGFLTLKKQLGLGWIWSSKPEVIGTQLWATVALALVLHALQVRTAHDLGVDPFDVSLELLWRYLPKLSQACLQRGLSLGEVLQERGGMLGVVRPSTRRRLEVPEVGWEEMTPPPIDLRSQREPRHAHKKSTIHDRRGSSTKRTGVI